MFEMKGEKKMSSNTNTSVQLSAAATKNCPSGRK